MCRCGSDSEKVPAALYDRLTATPTHAARMYKVQLRNYLKTRLRPKTVIAMKAGRSLPKVTTNA